MPNADTAASLVETAPRRPEVRFALAFVALERGDPAAAVRAADDALVLREHYPEARLVRAEALVRLARAEEARRELRRFLDEAPPTMVAERSRALQFLTEVPR